MSIIKLHTTTIALGCIISMTGTVCAQSLALATATPAHNADWKQVLEAGLNAEYPTTKVGVSMLTFDYNRITAPGGAFVVRIPGVYADWAATRAAILKTTIVDGTALQQKGFMAAIANTHAAKALKPGESVYILQEKVKDDGIEFYLLTQDTTDHEGQQTRYRSVIVFPVPREILPIMTIAEVKRMVNPIFATAEIANATESKTIQIGMGEDGVKTALGNPDKIVDLGAKQLFIYKDMKVVFVDGKVSDVQ